MIAEKTRLLNEMYEDIFLKQGKGWFRIISGSMRPLIRINDKILARKVTSSEVAPGDIILFKSSGLFVTHRVLKILHRDGETMILQCGDAGVNASYVSPESVFGKVVAIEKDGRILRLDKGRGRVLNDLYAYKAFLSYRFGVRGYVIKQWLRNKPGYHSIRTIYRTLRSRDFLSKG